MKVSKSKCCARVVALAIVVFAAATSAFATTANLSSPADNTPITNFGVVTGTAIANLAGGFAGNTYAAGNYYGLKNSASNATGNWVISGNLSTTGLAGTKIDFNFYTYSVVVANVVDTLNQIVFTDGSGHTATLNLTTGNSITPGGGSTISTFAFSTNLSQYTLSNVAFNYATVSGVQFTIGLNHGGNNKDIQIDAVDFISTAVPEPSSIALFAAGLAGLGAGIWRRRRTRREAAQRAS
jgi:hypothetical protein